MTTRIIPDPKVSDDGTAAAPLLALEGVRAAYDAITVLHGVDLEVAAGQVLTLLGPNGAGKTTALNVVAGTHPVTAGRLVLGGRDVTGARPATWPGRGCA